MSSPQHKEECKEIIPKQHYKCFDIETLNQDADYYVLRAANTEKPEDVFRDGIFRVSTFLTVPLGYGEAAGLSLNLLGGYFTEDHLKYIQKDEAASYWTEGTIVEIDALINHISIKEDRVPIYLPLLKLHNLQIPFEKKIMPNQIRKLPPGLAIEGKEQGNYRVRATLKVNHAPTKANFWHFEFELSDPTRDSDVKVVKSITSFKAEKEFKDQHATTKLVHSLLNKIQFFAKQKAGITKIPEAVYTKTDQR